jgi:signal transduction histidine kinase
MKRLTNSLLEYARAGRPGGEVVRVDPNQVIGDVLAEMDLRIRDTGVEVAVGGDLLAIEVDPIKLSQVVANLLDNAIKYMGENPSPRVEIGGEIRGKKAVIFVRDNGIGIAGDEIDAVFEPFKRFESAGEPGLGIGLSTVSKAVRGWGGEVWAESSPGRGSTFFFTAPLAS